jgi:PhnB protein
VTEFKPQGYATVTAYLPVEGAERVIEFAKRALDAEERLRMPGPGGSIGHAELQIGDSIVMLADVAVAADAMPGMLHLYVEDCDAAYRRALDAGATPVREPKDEFYGDRMAGVQDPAGNKWYFATHFEDVSDEEMVRRAAELAAGAGPPA